MTMVNINRERRAYVAQNMWTMGLPLHPYLSVAASTTSTHLQILAPGLWELDTMINFYTRWDTHKPFWHSWLSVLWSFLIWSHEPWHLFIGTGWVYLNPMIQLCNLYSLLNIERPPLTMIVIALFKGSFWAEIRQWIWPWLLMCLLVPFIMAALRISRQSVSLYLTVITLHFSSVAETPAPLRPHALFIYPIIRKKESARGQGSV